jgi:hypothetical protein
MVVRIVLREALGSLVRRIWGARPIKTHPPAQVQGYLGTYVMYYRHPASQVPGGFRLSRVLAVQHNLTGSHSRSRGAYGHA